MTEMMDFTAAGPVQETLEPIPFKIDDDVFHAYPEIGGGLLMDTISFEGLDQLQQLTEGDLDNLTQTQMADMMRITQGQTTKMMHFMDVVLLPESAERFAARMRAAGGGDVKPITLTQCFQVARWLMGKYGNRPTEPSSPSSNGHGGTGPSSTDGPQPAE